MEELSFVRESDTLFLGVDEVGRGPLAGPVVTASTLLEFPANKSPEKCVKTWLIFLRQLGIHDSKKVSPKKRQTIIDQFPLSMREVQTDQTYLLGEQNECRLWLRLAQLGPLEIDQLNILRASLEGMKRSSDALIDELFLAKEEDAAGPLLIDGSRGFKVRESLRANPLTKGDQRSLLIGLASIFAKELRDSLMEAYAIDYPGYGFDEHAGYPTQAHRRAIEKLGPCAIHRRSFKGVREFCPA